jgi:hypothetical protein
MEIYLGYFIQLVLIIHVLKTGRERYWILMLLFLPLIGGIAYLVVELIPEFSRSIKGQKASHGVKRLINPAGDIRRYTSAWEHSPNVENGRQLATALLEAGKTEEASRVIDTALSGFFKTDPTLLLLKARAQFKQDQFSECVHTLDELRDHHPDLRDAEGHLLYARALEGDGKLQRAIDEYRAVAGYYPGARARYQLALAISKTGDSKQAIEQLETLLQDAEHAPRHFRQHEKQWLVKARRDLDQLNAGAT